MKLSEYKNEDAIDLLADILEPTAKILSDKELADSVRKGASKITSIKIAMKNNKSSIVEILSRINGKSPDDYECNVITIMKDLLDILNDEALTDFFSSQQQMMEKTSSTSAMVNIEENAL